MDRSRLLAHLRKTHFAPGDRERALADAHAIAEFLKREYGVSVFGMGSLFDPERPFRGSSDIDLVVEGMPADRFFEASAKAAFMTEFGLDLIPIEDANDYIRQVVEKTGVEL